jgi:hypothetical protein
MIPVIWDTNYRGAPSMTVINRKDLSVYNPSMMDGIKAGVKAASTGISSITLDKFSSNTIFDLHGRKMDNAQLQNGVYIQNGRKWIKKD